MKTVAEKPTSTLSTSPPSPTTPQALIPEAREHRRRRHVRTALILVVTTLLLAALIVGAVLFSGGPSAEGQTHPGGASAGAGGVTAGAVYFRPVLCFAPAYDPAAHSATSSAAPSCSAASTLSAANLDTRPGGVPGGFESNVAPPDQALAGVPSTKPAAVTPSATVLLPGVPLPRHEAAGSAMRYVLGPAEMSSSAIESATATRSETGQWVVRYTTTASGAALWDKTAEENFHQFLAVELDGVVYTAPIIQPTQTAFTSFFGKGEVSGDLTKAQAQQLAGALQPHER